MDTIEKKAIRLLNSLNQFKFPVKVKSIIKEMGIKLEKVDLGEDISGALVIENGKPRIGYNTFESEVRQRFTLAHELGHYVLHGKGKDDYLFVDNAKVMFRTNKTSNQDYKREREANVFAASLLMPKSLIHEEFKSIEESSNHNLIEDEIVKEMASKFKVSQIAMTYRLINLGLIQQF